MLHLAMLNFEFEMVPEVAEIKKLTFGGCVPLLINDRIRPICGLSVQNVC